MSEPIPRSVIYCNFCNTLHPHNCYSSFHHSILSSVDISDYDLFQMDPNKKVKICSVCKHEMKCHERRIDEGVMQRLFQDARSMGDARDICDRLKYLGECSNQQKSKQIINMLKLESKEAPFLWMHIVWKNSYIEPPQKVELLRALDSAFSIDYDLRNAQGWNIIHILCSHENGCDKKSSAVLINYFVNECVHIDSHTFTAQCVKKRTPLHWAVHNSKRSVVKRLLPRYKKRQLLLKDNHGHTVLDMAKIQKLSKLHQYIQDYMDKLEDDDDDEDDEEKELYHEKQELEMCLLHAINSLLQEKYFTSKHLNDICKELAPNKLINPHKSMLQTGNYDANVLMMALAQKEIEVQWFDKRKLQQVDLDDVKFLEPDDKYECIGFILNCPQKAMFKLFERRHWLTIKRIDQFWYNLDSKLKEPLKFEHTQDATKFVKDALDTNSAELMICRKLRKNGKPPSLEKQPEVAAITNHHAAPQPQAVHAHDHEEHSSSDHKNNEWHSHETSNSKHTPQHQNAHQK
mmetsp:Transcript_15280/g.24031  ORF Transcript_15280/g.24031 Transcript_15280/m.24031 type:complete len:517 (+) Transcript_15280:937-2487(+)